MTIITILSIGTALLVVTSTSTVYSVLWLVSTFLIISALLGFLNLGFTALLYIIVYVGAIAILFLFVVQLLDLGSVSEQPVVQEYSNNLKDTAGLLHQQVDDQVVQKLNTLPVQSNYNSGASIKSITPLAIVISISLLSIIIFIAPIGITAAGINTDLIINTGSLELNTHSFYNGTDVKSLLFGTDESVNSAYMSTNSLINTSINSAPVQGSTPQVQSIAQWFYGPGLLPLVVISIILLVAMIAPISLCKDND